MIFRSHFLTMLIFAFIVSIIMALIKYDARKDILRYAVKLFILMCGGVVIFSWVMRFL